MSKVNWQEKETGAFWNKGSCFTGGFKVPKKDKEKVLAALEKGEEIRLVMFTNQKHEEGDNKPSYHVYLSEDRQQTSQAQTQAQDKDDCPF